MQACTREIGLDAEIFSEDLKSPAIENELQHQMQRARSMDGYSYPSLRLVHNGTVFPIVIDYLDYRTIVGICSSLKRLAASDKYGNYLIKILV